VSANARRVRPLTQAADFERVLAAPSRARSPHFAVHHLPAAPQRRRQAASSALVPQLSTADAPAAGDPVDKSCVEAAPAPAGLWLGTVVPKRHAKRAVTRNLLKRQIRALFDCHAGRLPAGLWVLRLRSPFDRQQFSSASSEALRRAVREELEALLQRATR
jgi:ribonuclease P protein component